VCIVKYAQASSWCLHSVYACINGKYYTILLYKLYYQILRTTLLSSIYVIDYLLLTYYYYIIIILYLYYYYTEISSSVLPYVLCMGVHIRERCTISLFLFNCDEVMKKKTVLPSIDNDEHASSFQSFFTPLSIYVQKEKRSREKYIQSNACRKCSVCKKRWQISLTKAKNGLYGSNPGLCTACKNSIEHPPLTPSKPISSERGLLSYVSNKYPAWILAEKDDPENCKTIFEALQNKESIEVIKYMCLRLPKKVFYTRNQNNLLPLSVAIKSMCSGEVILFILENNRSAAIDIAQNKYLPGMFAMIVGPEIRLKTVEMLIKAAGIKVVKDALYKLDKEGISFISRYVKLEFAGRAQLQLIIRTAGKEVLYLRDNKQWAPIHHACTSSNLIVIETMIHIDPEQLLLEDGTNGMLPFQYFIQNSSHFDYLTRECCYQSLTERKKYRKSMIQHVDKAGRTSMHIAILYNAPIDILESLLGTNIIDLSHQDKNGKTCLHLALQNPAVGTRFVELLLKKCSAAARCLDCNGWSALRYFLHYYSDDELMRYKTEENRDDLQMKNEKQRRDWTENERFFIMTKVLKADKTSVQVPDNLRNGELPLHFVLRARTLPKRHAMLLSEYKPEQRSCIYKFHIFSNT
jgi:ankyrin repeat protein